MLQSYIEGNVTAKRWQFAGKWDASKREKGFFKSDH